MPAPISEPIKSRVVEMWLFGHNRDYVASVNRISTGAVSNIVKEWEAKIGKDVLHGLRELGVLLKREGLSPAQCAIGFRIMKIFADKGVDAETAEHFVLDIYAECNKLGFTPSNIVAHIEDLAKFSKEGKVRLPEIGAYVENKIDEKKDLKVEVEQLNIAVATLEEKKSELDKSCAVVLEQKRKAENEMKSYFDSKQEMEKLGISMNNDIPKFVGTVKSVKGYGYDPQVVVAELFDIQYYRDNLRALKIAIKEGIKVHERLESQNSSLLKNIALHSEKADLYNELNHAGFGINELRRLLETVKNIAMSNQIGHWAAAGKLFNDIKTQYNAILGFESAKEELVTEISKLESERKEKLENIRNFPFIGPIIAGLLSLGLNESDILKLGKILFDIRKKSYSLKEMALIMINAVEEMATSNTIAIRNVEVIEILGRTREELSRLG